MTVIIADEPAAEAMALEAEPVQLGLRYDGAPREEFKVSGGKLMSWAVLVAVAYVVATKVGGRI